MAEAEGTVDRQSDQSASGSHLATVDQRLVEQRQISRRRHATATGPTQRPPGGSVGVVLLRLRQAHLRARIDEIQSATGRSVRCGRYKQRQRHRHRQNKSNSNSKSKSKSNSNSKKTVTGQQQQQQRQRRWRRWWYH